MTKTFHVELWDVEGDYITSRAVDAGTPQEAASKALPYARKAGAESMTIRRPRRDGTGRMRKGSVQFRVADIEEGRCEDATKRGPEGKKAGV